MKKEAFLWIRRLLCWPLVLYGYLISGLIKISTKGTAEWVNGIPVVTIPENSWPLKIKPFGGITFGHGIILVLGQAREQVLAHEGKHVEQTESSTLAGFILGIICALSIFSWSGIAVLLICWMGAAPVVYIASSIISVLYGKDFYQGNNLEKAARNGE